MKTRRPHVLVVGSGGREHAIVQALASSPRGPTLYCAPGNAGTAEQATNVAIGAEEVERLVEFSTTESFDLVVVGPEAPLVAGLADRLREVDIAVVGPSAKAAQLEGSKAFANRQMERYGVPTARSREFTRAEIDDARRYVSDHAFPVVVKADGLAAGKGVVVAETTAQALQAVDDMLRGHAFGKAGSRIVVEEFLEGEELSVFALTDGTDYMLLPPSQDHKQIGDGDVGPNTGGMGAYAPTPLGSKDVLKRVEEEIVRPMLGGMREDEMPYEGILYAGLMIAPDGSPSVVEFNCRLGDPEAQVVLPLVGAQTLDLFEATAAGDLRDVEIQPMQGSAACVVLASEGYPGSYEKGFPIFGLDDLPTDVSVIHAGTRAEGDTVVTAGGRVVGIVGVADDLPAAIDLAYRGVSAIDFQGKTYRNDIGRKGLERLRKVAR